MSPPKLALSLLVLVLLGFLVLRFSNGASEIKPAPAELETASAPAEEIAKPALAVQKALPAVESERATALEANYSDLSEAELFKKYNEFNEKDPNGHAEEMRALARMIARLRPNDPAAYKMLALAEMAAENMNSNEAIAAIERGLELSPNDQDLHEQWYAVKIMDESFDFKKNADEHPGDPNAQYYEISDRFNKASTEEAKKEAVAAMARLCSNREVNPIQDRCAGAMARMPHGGSPPIASNSSINPDSATQN